MRKIRTLKAEIPEAEIKGIEIKKREKSEEKYISVRISTPDSEDVFSLADRNPANAGAYQIGHKVKILLSVLIGRYTNLEIESFEPKS